MSLFRLHLNIHVCALGDGIEDGRVRSQSLQAFHVVHIGLDLELDADFREALRHIVGESQETAQVDVAFKLGFQFLDMDTPYRGMCHHARGYTGSQRIEQMFDRIGAFIIARQNRGFIGVQFELLVYGQFPVWHRKNR